MNRPVFNRKLDSLSRLSVECIRTPADNPFEQCLRLMLIGWQQYAEAYKKEYDQIISKDTEIDLPWETIGQMLQLMLYGEIGNMNFAGTEKFIEKTLADNGFTKGPFD